MRVSGWPYTIGARNGPARSGSSRYSSAATPTPTAMQRPIKPRRLKISGSTARTNRPIPGAASSATRWSAMATPYAAAAARSQRSAPGRGPSSERTRDSQASSRANTMPRSSDVEGVGVGVRRDPPCDRRQEQDETGRDRDQHPARQLADEDDGDGGGARDVHRREDVHPEGRRPHRLEQAGSDPAQDGVGGEPGRMEGPEERRHGLELRRVPEPDAGHERRPGEREGDDGHDDGPGEPDAGDDVFGQAVPGSGGTTVHHP